MIEFPKDTKFKYSWRKYQQRIFDHLDQYLNDKHLHIIAPPGSGKTVLGLEVALRLNQPVLIMAPTIAIRNQWIQRFCELFLQTDLIPDWISKDIRRPELMTVVTYQALHAACNNLNAIDNTLKTTSNNLQAIEQEEEEEEETEETEAGISKNQHLEEIVSGLKEKNIRTVIFDEAHHLQNEWWRTLIKVKAQLDPVVIGLTATPPYDVSANEWERYLELNGPVDAEIFVPELIREGDLCPHQDYVHFTTPTAAEYQHITAFRENISKLLQEFKTDETLAIALESHPVWINPKAHLEWIYTNLSYYSASLIFLNAVGREISDQHLEVVGHRKKDIPVLNYSWMETMLYFYLYGDKENFIAFAVHRKELENKLSHYGALSKKQISLWHNKKIAGLLTSSISKLNSIKEITDFEYRQSGAKLRLVILSDYIRKEYYTDSAINELELNKMGVMPVFEKLRRENTAGIKIGVLTGSMIIIPVSARPSFERLAARYGNIDLFCTTVPFDHSYLLIQHNGQIKQDIIYIITQLFEAGEIQALVGTKSLLGEGWDAPAINSLILASFVGSFVSSNQMRGRAIRTQIGNAGKTANIWHLICADPGAENGGDDFETLKRRFKSFAGISCGERPGIENGIRRLNITGNISNAAAIADKNATTFKLAADRDSLGEKWTAAITSGVELIEEISIPFGGKRPYKQQIDFYFTRTIAYLVTALFSGLTAFGEGVFNFFSRSVRYMNSWDAFFHWVALTGIIGFVFFGRRGYFTLRMYIRYRDISTDLRQIGIALLHALIKAGLIRTDLSVLTVVADKDTFGVVSCHLDGGTGFEKSVFIQALKEITGPIENPRYVIIRKSWLFSFVRQKDYHAVPELIGKNKNLAEYFKMQWTTLAGPCNLIFTRTVGGHRLLLKSRMESLSAQFEEMPEQIRKWK